MRRLIAKRERIVRARRVQHVLASVKTTRAQNEALALEDNAQRVRSVRAELFDVGKITSGAALASHRELAGRLEQAGRQLDGAIYDAHKRVEQREGERQLANRDQEIAERLKEKAARAAAEQMEARLQSLPRRNRSVLLGDV
ncbi:MAG: hypothetical protein JJE34_06640 [Alphaproteobacteria bacterium]|nr:hypothetical protein [Alphaproteobacteria bacterium]